MSNNNRSNNAYAGGDDTAPLTNDELAVRLIQCAALVKKGEKGQLVRDTIYDLTFYLTGKLPNGARSPSSSAVLKPTTTQTPTQQPPAKQAAQPTVAHDQQQQSSSPPQEEISQPQVAQPSLTPTSPRSGDSALGSAESQPPQPQHSHRTSNVETVSTSSLESQQALAGPDGTLSKHRVSPIKQVLGRVIQGDTVPERSMASKVSTSEKNAARAVTDMQQGLNNASTKSLNSVADQQSHTTQNGVLKRPAFHRPTNPNSPLIANGWIEQNRRSKMRSAWKEVLASLVEARKPGEETTFWIQRETGIYNNGKPELEALHQIPVKWISEVRYDEYSTDYKFTIRLSNINEDFVFRCARNEEAAQNWVLTLRSANEIALRSLRDAAGTEPPGVPTGLNSWDSANSRVSSDDEKKIPEQQQSTRPTQPPPQPSMPTGTQNQQLPSPPQLPSDVTQRMSVKELRAIAHGAGIMTHGMERKDLEHVVESIARASIGYNPGPHPPQQPSVATAPPPQQIPGPPPSHIPSPPPSFGAPQVVPNDDMQRQKEEDHRRIIAERVRQQQEMEKRRRDDEERKRLEQERIRQEEEAHRKRVADMQAAAERQRQEEQQRRQQQQWQQQQQEWQRQEAEKRAAEERRRQEELARTRAQQQQWHHQQQQGPPNQQWRGGPPPFNGVHPPQQNPQFPGGQPQPNYPPTGSSAHQRSSSAPHAHHPQQSAANMKYAKMAQQSDDDNSIALHAIKHGVLLQWALCPPTMQMLKPIEHLLAEMPNTFPPRFNVPKHDHFLKWTPIRPDEVCSGPGRPDPDKLTKTMRKLRLFLHPDKLPRDFTKEQEHLCKLLWDITSDAYEDFKKGQDDLSWVRS